MKKAIRIIIIIALIVAAILAYSAFRKKKNRPEWRTDVPSMGSVREVVTATGSLNPHILVNVGTEVSGKIEKLYKDYNSVVKRGELLAKLDTELLETNIASSRSDVARAKVTADEAKLDLYLLRELFNKGMTPEYEVRKAEFKHEQAVLSLNNAQLSLQRAQKNLDNAYINSPIDGVIVSRNVDEGQTVAASLNAPTLFVIANNLENMQITAAVDEADIGKISLNLPVEFTVDAYSGERFRGVVNQIRLNPNSEQNVVSYNVIINAENPQRKLLPGMTANVTIVVQSKENVLRIPESATRFRPSKELWTLFGLKWDDELLASGSRRAMMAQSAAADTAKAKVAGTTATDRKPPAAASSAAPDSLRGRGSRRGRSEAAPTSGGETFQLATGTTRRTSSRMAQIWVIQNGIPTPRMVRVGLSDGANVEVLEGVSEGEQMVTGVIYKNATQSAANSPMMGGPRRF